VSDYWLGKFIYDLQASNVAEAYLVDRAAVLDRYPLAPKFRTALLQDDLEGLIGNVNPYLLRYYFSCVGLTDHEFISRLRASVSPQEATDG
jgi:Aromatic-ring-opening dioxygenase LigAB, LigA subunit